MSDHLIDFLKRSGVSILMLVLSTIVSFTFGRWWGGRKARREWQEKVFLGRINVSLNLLAGGWLKIRTVFERPLEAVFTNPVAEEKIRAASLQTTAENPILPIAKEDSWFLLNFVLNAVAEHFSVGTIRQDAGVPVHAVRYAIFLTSEVVGEDRIRKVRAMLVKADLLKNFPYTTEMPQLENPWHETRVQTLRKAADLYQKRPEDFLHVELCV